MKQWKELNSEEEQAKKESDRLNDIIPEQGRNGVLECSYVITKEVKK